MSSSFNVIDILEKQIGNIQPMIQSQDNKISFLLVFCCLPVSQLEHFKKMLLCLTTICNGKLLVSILIVSWFLSIFVLLFGLYPKNKFERIEFEINNQNYKNFLENDYKKVMDILSSKIKHVRNASKLIFLWSFMLLISEIIYWGGLYG